MTPDKVKSLSLTRLQHYPEWKVFEEHIREIAQSHDLASAKFSRLHDIDSATRQAWISEGLIEAIEEPERFSGWYGKVSGHIEQVCKLCRQVLPFFKRQKAEGSTLK